MRVKHSVGLIQKAQLISASFLFVFRLKKKSFKVRNRIKLYPCYSLCTLCRRNLQRRNFPTLLMVTLIRRENRAFRKRSSNCRNWKTLPLRLRVDKNHFENLRFSKTIIITVIMWFPWPSFLQTRILNKAEMPPPVVIWTIQGRAAEQGMFFWPRCHKKGTQFDSSLYKTGSEPVLKKLLCYQPRDLNPDCEQSLCY